MKELTQEQKNILKIIMCLHINGTKKSFLEMLNEYPIKNFNTIVPIKENSKDCKEYRNSTLLKEAFFEFYFAQIQENKTKSNSCASIIKYIVEKGGRVDSLIEEKEENISLAHLWSSIISTPCYLLRPNIENKLTNTHQLLLQNLANENNQLNPNQFFKELNKNKEGKNISNDYLLYELYGYANQHNLIEITDIFLKHINNTLDNTIEKVQDIALQKNEKHFIANIRDKTSPNNALAYIKRANKTHNFVLLLNTVKENPTIKELIINNTLKRIQLSQNLIEQQRKIYGGDVSKPNNTTLFNQLNLFFEKNEMNDQQKKIFMESVSLEKSQCTNTSKKLLIEIENSALKKQFSNTPKKNKLKQML